MKYILILFGAIMIARIDILIHGIESIFNKVEDKKNAKIVENTDLPTAQPTEIISIKEDHTLKVTPRLEFFTLIEEFRLKPSNGLRNKIGTVIQKNPNLFTETIDRDLEAQIYKMADLIYNKSNEFALLLVDLVQNLKGENKEMIQKFFTVMMDSNINLFISSYSLTQDKNCIIGKSFGLKIPEDEILNELLERRDRLETYLNQPKIDPLLLQFAQNCLLVLNIELDKIQPKEDIQGQSTENVPQVPVPTPVENQPLPSEPSNPPQG